MKNRKKGMTLTEMMFSVTIFGLVLAGTFSVFLGINKSMYEVEETIDLNAASRIVHEKILTDIRSLTGVTAINPTEFSGKFVDLNTGNTGTITYQLKNGTLKRTTTVNGGTNAQTLMTGLITEQGTTYSKFSYKNRNGTGSADATQTSEVRSIQIQLVPKATTRQAAKLTNGKNEPFYTALVQIRNFVK